MGHGTGIGGANMLNGKGEMEPIELLETLGVDIYAEVRVLLCGTGQQKHGDSWQGRANALDSQKAWKHFRQWEAGEREDHESGLSPLIHTIARLVLIEARSRCT